VNIVRTITSKRFLHLVVLPLVLVSSDLLIGFIGHFAGSTGNNFTWEAFSEYFSELTFPDVLPIIIIAFIVIGIVELINRRP